MELTRMPQKMKKENFFSFFLLSVSICVHLWFPIFARFRG